MAEFFHCADRFKNSKNMISRKVCWEKPDPGWMKLNTDGASNSSLGIAGGGSLLTDDAGKWVVGFARKIGKADSFLAELWALRDGLLLCQQMNLTAIIIELDAKAIVDALTNLTYSNSIVSTLFHDCRQLVTSFSQHRIRQVYLEANSCADRLANLGCAQVSNFILFSSPPVDLLNVFEADSQGLYSNRLCPEPLFSS